MPPKVANVGAALAQHAQKTAAIGPTIQVRATRKGFYGRPLPALREEGTVFAFAVKDLQPYAKGVPDREVITVDGTKYLLPSWVEDAAKPVRADEPDEEEFDQGSGSDDVI